MSIIFLILYYHTLTYRSSSLLSVDDWLVSHGFDLSTLERTPAKDWITIVLPVSKAEEMLGTEYAVWEHAESGEKIVRTMEYSLPESVHAHGEYLSICLP